MVVPENGSKGAQRLKVEKQYWKTTFYAMIQPAMILLFMAATIRQAGKQLMTIGAVCSS
jgi:hypothetical protein